MLTPKGRILNVYLSNGVGGVMVNPNCVYIHLQILGDLYD